MFHLNERIWCRRGRRNVIVLTEAASFDTDPTSSSRVRSIRFLSPANKHSRSACSTTGSRGRLGAAVRMLASTAGKKGGVPGCGNISISTNPDIFFEIGWQLGESYALS